MTILYKVLIVISLISGATSAFADQMLLLASYIPYANSAITNTESEFWYKGGKITIEYNYFNPPKMRNLWAGVQLMTQVLENTYSPNTDALPEEAAFDKERISIAGIGIHAIGTLGWFWGQFGVRAGTGAITQSDRVLTYSSLVGAYASLNLGAPPPSSGIVLRSEMEQSRLTNGKDSELKLAQVSIRSVIYTLGFALGF